MGAVSTIPSRLRSPCRSRRRRSKNPRPRFAAANELLASAAPAAPPASRMRAPDAASTADLLLQDRVPRRTATRRLWPSQVHLLEPALMPPEPNRQARVI